MEREGNGRMKIMVVITGRLQYSPPAISHNTLYIGQARELWIRIRLSGEKPDPVFSLNLYLIWIRPVSWIHNNKEFTIELRIRIRQHAYPNLQNKPNPDQQQVGQTPQRNKKKQGESIRHKTIFWIQVPRPDPYPTFWTDARANNFHLETCFFLFTLDQNLWIWFNIEPNN